MDIVTSQQMRNIDQRTIQKYEISGSTLMRNAAKSIYEYIADRIADYNVREYIVFCGNGNNGGDGYELARLLLACGAFVKVISYGKAKDDKSDAVYMKEQYLNTGGKIINADTFMKEPFKAKKDAIVIDAVFGTGLNSDITEVAKKLIGVIDQLPYYKIAIDLPSGINADNGHVMGIAVHADVTIALCLRKIAHVLSNAKAYMGEVIVKKIGIPKEAIDDEELNIRACQKQDALEILPVYDDNEHKGSCGKVLVVGGSRTMYGAPVMASIAALRSGSGLVRTAVPETIWSSVAAKTLEVMSVPLRATQNGTISVDDLDKILELSEKSDAVVVGCGLSIDDDTKQIVYELIKQSNRPLLIDADGLSIIALNTEVLSRSTVPIVLTPHVVEMSRLNGLTVAEIENDRISVAQKFAMRYGNLTVVLKGPNTITASSDGKVFVNTSGNPGMATAGSGDVLAGVIGSFMAKNIDPFLAAATGAYIHGRAGDKAAEELSQYGMIASDIIARLPYTLKDQDRLL